MAAQAPTGATHGVLEYRALGAIGLTDGGEPVGVGGPTQRRLLALMLIHRNTVVTSDRLCDVLFAGEPTSAAPTTVRSYIARLRRVVERPGSGTRVITQPPGYKLEVGDEAFDVVRFERAVAAARRSLTRGDAAGAVRTLRDGLDLWRGGAYAEFGDEDWARPEAQRLGELHLVAHELLAEAELASGSAAEGTSELEALAAEHPLRESLHAKLMRALYLSGRQAEALRVYEAYRRALAEEMGLEPAPELADLERRILTHDSTLGEARSDELPLRGYRLGERLGTGRGGTVHAARLPGVDRDIAIRVIPEDVANDPAFVRTFDRDARRLAAVRHHAIVSLYDWWREAGAAYVVMRRLRGGSLRDRLRQGPLPVDDVAALVGRVGGALAAAVEAGVPHGHVVAESVLYDEAGVAHLGDFPLGIGDGRLPADDVRDLATLVGEALGGASPSGPVPGDAPANLPVAVAALLTDVLSTAEPPPLESFVAAVVEGLSGDVVPAEHERPNPYKGLRAFDEPDADDFFGRDDLVEQIVHRLAVEGPRGRLVLVVGGSGSGKSSLVRAGLLPRVRRGAAGTSERWFVATMVPGSSPFRELAEALDRVAVVETRDLAAELAAEEQGIDRVVRRIVPDGGELLLVVDQLEELFTLADEDDQRAFLDGLTRAVAEPGGRLRVVAALRADFYDRPLRFDRFGAAVGDATVPIAAMSPAELEAAIVGPAARVGADVEPALVAELVGALLHEPAALPSLQYALYELAGRRSDRCLTLADYRQLGGVDAAIAARAEELYQSLDDRQQRGVRHLFERLVVVGAEGEPTRRRALRSEVEHAAGASAGDVMDVIETWAQARLLTLDRHPESREPTVEVAHEALLREWPRLRGWLEEDREEIVALAQLRDAAAGWENLDHDPGALYRGARLDTALQLVAGRSDELPPTEQEFVAASRDERDRERQRDLEQLGRTARANRRLRALLASVAALLVVALVAGALAFGESHRADDRATDAEARRILSQVEPLTTSRRDVALLLALEADRIRPGVETESVVLGAVQADAVFLGYANLPDHAAEVSAAAIAGDRLVVGDTRGRLTVFDRATNAPVSGPVPVGEPDQRVRSLVADPSGTQLAVAFTDSRQVRLLDVDELVAATPEGPRLGRALDMPAAPFRLALDARGRLAVGDLTTGTARVVDSRSGAVLATMPPPRREPNDRTRDLSVTVTFSDDGRLATGTGDALRLWSAEDLSLVREVRAPGVEVDGTLEVTPDGTIVSGRAWFESFRTNPRSTGPMAWERDGTPLWEAPLDAKCWDIAISETELLCVEPSGTVIAYDLRTGRETERVLDLQIGPIRDLVVSPDQGEIVAIAQSAPVVGRWSLDGRSGLGPIVGSPGSFPVNYSPDGDLVLLTSSAWFRTGPRQLWDSASGALVNEWDMNGGAFVPGGLIAGALVEGDAVESVLLDPITGSRSPLAPPSERVFTSAATDQERGRLAFGYRGWAVDQRDLSTGDVVGPMLNGSTSALVNGLAYLDGGRALAVAISGSVDVFDADTGDLLLGPFDGEWVAASPDGSVFVTATRDGQVTLRNPTTGEPTAPAITDAHDGVNAIEVSADNERMMVASEDSSVRIFDLAGPSQIGRPLTTDVKPAGYNSLAALRPDGRQLALATRHGVQLLNLDRETLRDAACVLAGRNLTHGEWERYMPSGQSYRATCEQWPAGG